VTERLLRLLLDAAGGAPPPADGVVEVWAAPTGPVDAVLAFTAHHVVAAAVDPDLVAARLPDGDLSAPMGPAFLGWLGERLGSRPGSLDVVLAAGGLGGSPPLELTPGVDLDRHEPVVRALRYRSDLQVWTAEGDAGVLVLGRGLAGRREVAFEVDPTRRNRGLGRSLVAAAPAADAARRAVVRAGRPRQRRLPAGGGGGRLPPHRRRGPVPPRRRRPG
jgi:hypothetical protein